MLRFLAGHARTGQGKLAIGKWRNEMWKSMELFAGAGGLGLGLAQAGFMPHLVIERDKWCCYTLRLNHAKFAMRKPASLPNQRNSRIDRVVDRDICVIDFSHYEGSLDLISGEPPCQPFSMGGRHRAQADARDMFPQAVRAIRQAKPKAFVFENVKGLTHPTFAGYNEDELWEDHLRRGRQHHRSSEICGLHNSPEKRCFLTAVCKAVDC